jgi:cellulase/cellobiase CelA1
VTAQWAGGFSALIKICNISPQPISGWTLQFTFPGDQQVTQGWNGNVSQSGKLVTITSTNYNGLIEPGQCIYLGFNGTWTTSDASPTSFLFDGVPTN